MSKEFHLRWIHIEPSIEDIDVDLVDEATVMETQRWVFACEHCAENAAIPFDYLLDASTGCDPATTDYVMYRPARCPRCSREVTEKTLVVV